MKILLYILRLKIVRPYNSQSTGIELKKVENGTLIDNNCSYNHYRAGIYLNQDCINNTILGNTANKIYYYGIYLEDSHNNIVSENTANDYGTDGILLIHSNNHIITRNTANNHYRYGIFLSYSNNSIVSENILIDNGFSCFHEYNSYNNYFENNYCPKEEPTLLGYNLFFLFGILIVVSSIISKKKKSWNKHS